MSAGRFETIDAAQNKICSPYKIYEPEPAAQRIYADRYEHYRQLYFAFGQLGGKFGKVVPALIQHARS